MSTLITDLNETSCTSYKQELRNNNKVNIDNIAKKDNKGVKNIKDIDEDDYNDKNEIDENENDNDDDSEEIKKYDIIEHENHMNNESTLIKNKQDSVSNSIFSAVFKNAKHKIIRSIRNITRGTDFLNQYNIKTSNYSHEMTVEDENINYNYKNIKDPVHGQITFSNLAMSIIDTPEFQRLRYISQLGIAQYVYPTGNHTRFEHLLGTYYLAMRILDSIVKHSDKTHINTELLKIKELNAYFSATYGDILNTKIKICLLDNFICELVKIAALIHDVAHGPWSHLFDDLFLRGDKNNTHESRAIKILKLIINREMLKGTDIKLSSILTDDICMFIADLIDPKDPKDFQELQELKESQESKESKEFQEANTCFIYQIISNSLNSIDVDKLDYLARDSYHTGTHKGVDYLTLLDKAVVIKNTICYPIQMKHELINIFKIRYELHRQVYQHYKALGVQDLFLNMMREADHVLKLRESLNDISEFCRMTESYVIERIKLLANPNDRQLFGIKLTQDQEEHIAKAFQFWNRIVTRNLYKYIGDTKNPDILKNIEFKIAEKKIKDGVFIAKSTAGFISGNKANPLDNLYVYSNKDMSKRILLKKEDISLLPSEIKETTYVIFAKNNDVKDELTKIYNECI